MEKDHAYLFHHDALLNLTRSIKADSHIVFIETPNFSLRFHLEMIVSLKTITFENGLQNGKIRKRNDIVFSENDQSTRQPRYENNMKPCSCRGTSQWKKSEKLRYM